MLRHALRLGRRSEVRRRAITATLGGAFALLLAVGGWVILTATTSLADEVFRHIHEMPAALSFGRGTSHEMLATGALRGIGAEATGDLGDVLFANLCVFKERRIAHIILKGRSAPVTVMIMPREPVSAPRHIWSDDQKGLYPGFATS